MIGVESNMQCKKNDNDDVIKLNRFRIAEK